MGRASNARGRLIQVAVELFETRSYGSVGVEAICQKAGVNKGSFYYFFPTKSTLAIAALETYWQTYEHRVLQPAFQLELSPVERLTRFCLMNYLHHKQARQITGRVHGCLLGNLGGEVSGQEEVLRQKIQEILRRFEKYFEETLRDAEAAGFINPGTAVPTAAALLAYLEGKMLLAKIQNDVESLQDLTPDLFRLIGVREPVKAETVQPKVSPTEVTRFNRETLDFID